MTAEDYHVALDVLADVCDGGIVGERLHHLCQGGGAEGVPGNVGGEGVGGADADAAEGGRHGLVAVGIDAEGEVLGRCRQHAPGKVGHLLGRLQNLESGGGRRQLLGDGLCRGQGSRGGLCLVIAEQRRLDGSLGGGRVARAEFLEV